MIALSKNKIKSTWFILVISACLTGCDYYAPQREFRLAISYQDDAYSYAARHFKEVLEQGPYKIKIINAKSVKEAVELVASNKADLTMAMNHSSYLFDSIGASAAQLRTILPLFRRFMFMYVHQDAMDSLLSPKGSFHKRIIGVEYLYSETHIDLLQILEKAQAEKNYTITADTTYDLYHIWGTAYSRKHLELSAKGWKRLSFADEWIKFIDLNNPFVHPIVIPAIPKKEESTEISTIYTETLLLGSRNLGEEAVRLLTRYIYQNRIHLLNRDQMFTSIDERYEKTELLFPIHVGADEYLRRDDPAFLERYADTLALFVTLIAFAYGIVQAIRLRMSKKRKDQVDKYYIEFLSIKENIHLSVAEQVRKYDELFQRVLTKMTEEKLEKDDFHILSRLIQTELTILKLGK